MPGETEEKPSGWTTDTLHAHITRLMDERDRRYGERFDAQALAVAAALAAAEKATTKAEGAAERRFEAVNEFRGQQQDIISTFMPRAEADLAMANVQKQLDEIKGTRRAGLEAGWGYLVGAVGLLAGVAGLVIALSQ